MHESVVLVASRTWTRVALVVVTLVGLVESVGLVLKLIAEEQTTWKSDRRPGSETQLQRRTRRWIDGRRRKASTRGRSTECERLNGVRRCPDAIHSSTWPCQSSAVGGADAVGHCRECLWCSAAGTALPSRQLPVSTVPSWQHLFTTADHLHQAGPLSKAGMCSK